MGLLDDAIREHLELKRRHGADASEVERQEQEALGPARRGTAPVEEAELPEADAGPLESGAVSVETLRDEDDRATGLYDDEDAELAAEAEPEPEPETDELKPSVRAGEPAAPVVPPAPAGELAHPADDDDVDAEVIEGAEPAPREATPDDAGPDAAEDVLEETPDFLQETPEHDRLWFEQKPPRDFEF